MTKNLTLALHWIGPLPQPGELVRRTNSPTTLTITHVTRIAGAPTRSPNIKLTLTKIPPNTPPQDPTPTTHTIAKTPARSSPPTPKAKPSAALVHNTILAFKRAATAELRARRARWHDDDPTTPTAQTSSGKAVPANWSDPDDHNPNRRSQHQKQVRGLATPDPITHLAQVSKLVSEDHVLAANSYRLAWELGPGHAHKPGWNHEPPTGSTAHHHTNISEQQLDAMRSWTNVQKIFNQKELNTLEFIVLAGQSVSAWAQRNNWPREPAVGYLISILDRLVKYYDVEAIREQAEKQGCGLSQIQYAQN